MIGLVAYNDLWVAEYAPDQLDWTASVLVVDEYLALRGQQPRSGSEMTFTGSAATANGRQLRRVHHTHVYAYDPNLQFLPPPWFPAVDDYAHHDVLPRGRAVAHAAQLGRHAR